MNTGDHSFRLDDNNVKFIGRYLSLCGEKGLNLYDRYFAAAANSFFFFLPSGVSSHRPTGFQFRITILPDW